MYKVIAIDGPSGAGKSTVAKLLAERLGFSYLDTGALYRAVALMFIEKEITPEDDDIVLLAALNLSDVRFFKGRIFLNNRDVSTDIRKPEIGQSSSVFSAKKVVRDTLLRIQRAAAIENNLVVEGRDTATVIFPDAWKKFYMDAAPKERANRRYRQLKDMGLDITDETAQEDVSARDNRDRSREVAPLKKAEDAIILDTTDKTAEQVVADILELIQTGV